jgi:hypothetical protein
VGNEPLGSSEVKIDVVTGKPFTSGESPMEPEGFGPEEREEEKRKLEKAVSQRNELISDLAGTGGLIVREVVKLFVKRLEELSEKDPECAAYLKMLAVGQHRINIGEKAITKMAEDLLKYAAPAGDTGKK